jgi:hypothetical protein
MNFTIKLEDFTLKNACFLEPKKNMIMDGSFTKINYLDQYFTMNSIFITVPLTIKAIDNNIKFDPYLSTNYPIVQGLVNIESLLLQLYTNTKQQHFKHNTLLAKQLFNGNMKINKDDTRNVNSAKKTYIIKISGIWESDNEIGITYKLFMGESIIL